MRRVGEGPFPPTPSHISPLQKGLALLYQSAHQPPGHHPCIGGSGLPGTLFPNHLAFFSSVAPCWPHPSHGRLNI